SEGRAHLQRAGIPRCRAPKHNSTAIALVSVHLISICHLITPKLGMKTESLQALERGKRCVRVLGPLLLLISLTPSEAVQAQPDSLEQLANDFWAWRAKYAPFTSDDVNRIERSGGTRDWSRASIDRRKKDLV